MARRLRADMIAETRASLIAAGREAFGTVGYAAASMDELTATAGLTRGALYHHFGDKKGLFAAVLDQIDAEMTVRLRAVSARRRTAGPAFATRARPISPWRWNRRSSGSSCVTARPSSAIPGTGRSKTTASG